MKSGACSVSALVTEGQLVVANAGDCKAVLCRGGKAEALTTLHRANNKEERQRIEDLVSAPSKHASNIDEAQFMNNFEVVLYMELIFYEELIYKV